MEDVIHFNASALRLEGRLQVGEARAVVVTHPHPLYGGNLHNPVVEAIAASYQRRGYTTLRFNFRGVEASQGHYDEGRGEQQDLGRAIDYLRQSGYGPVELSGYSFGTWVNAHYAAKIQPDIAMTMVSPPTAFMDFRAVRHLPGLARVITGSRDDIAPPDLLGRLVPQWNPDARLEIVSGADHFFFDHMEDLKAALNAVPAASDG